MASKNTASNRIKIEFLKLSAYGKGLVPGYVVVDFNDMTSRPVSDIVVSNP
jgi:hypothetical protein